MGRLTRLQHKRRGRRVRLLIFMSGGLLTGFMLIWVLIWLEQRSTGKDLSHPPRAEETATKPTTASEDTKDSFIFYEVLEQRNPDGSELMPLIPKPQEPIPSLHPPSVPTVAPRPDHPPKIVGGLQVDKAYTVQVAAFSDKATAQTLTARLIQKGYQAYLIPQPVPGKGFWYRVRVGHYRERDEAERMTERLLKREQLTSFVVVESSTGAIK